MHLEQLAFSEIILPTDNRPNRTWHARVAFTALHLERTGFPFTLCNRLSTPLYLAPSLFGRLADNSQSAVC